jgi:5-formyltetrahydrofolate cyclo-ligase
MTGGKQVLRAELRRRRSALSERERTAETQATVAQCLDLIARCGGGPVASYLACGGELDLDALHRQLWSAGGRVLLPRVAGPGVLTWHEIRPHDRTPPGAHGIREPEASAPALPLPRGVLILVPGVAFSAAGDRLGQGGGYYDRLLAVRSGLSVGVGFACQRCDAIPSDPHDQQVDGVVLGGQLLRDPCPRLEP